MNINATIKAAALILLAALWPFLNFADHNWFQLTPSALAVTALGFLVTWIAGLLMLPIAVYLRHKNSYENGAMVVVALILLLFLYLPLWSLFQNDADNRLTIATLNLSLHANTVYALFFLVIMLTTWWVRFHEVIITFTRILLFISVLFPLGGITQKIIDPWLNPRTFQTHFYPEINVDGLTFKQKPNVYFIIADMFPRRDQMQRIFNDDSTSFYQALQRRNLFVAEKSYANYPWTFMSVNSTLMMGYPVTETSKPFKDRKPFYEVMNGDNPVFDVFRRNGYSIARAFPGYFDMGTCTDGDICISVDKVVVGQLDIFSRTRETQVNLLAMLPIPEIKIPSLTMDKTRASVPSHTTTDIRDVINSFDKFKSTKPLFLFAHTNPPHSPLIFNPDCSYRNNALRVGSIDNIVDNTPQVLINEIRCVETQIIELIDWVKINDPDGLVIIQSDHGLRYRSPLNYNIPYNEVWPPGAFESVFGILNIFHMSEKCHDLLYPEISPVNTFRAIFSCLTEKNIPYLEDMSYIAGGESHPKYGKVKLFSF